jgi:hypothetical protein
VCVWLHPSTPYLSVSFSFFINIFISIFHCDISTHSYSVPWLGSSPPSFSLTPLLPYLKQCQQVSSFYFHTWIQNTSTIFSLLHHFLIPFSLPLVPTSGHKLLYLPVLRLLKKNTFVSLWWLHRDFCCDISIYTCFIIPLIGSSPPLFPSYPIPLLKVTSTDFRIPR